MILASLPPLLLALALTAALAYAGSAVGSPAQTGLRSRLLVGLAWLLHGLLLGLTLFGELPRFGFGPALSVTAWLVAAVYAVESLVYPQLQTRWVLATLGACAVLLGILFPGHPSHADVTLWELIHSALGIASYGVIAVAVVHAWFSARTEERMRLGTDSRSGMPLLALERLTFQLLGAGFVLLTLTLGLGLLYGNPIGGASHPLKWDHKTVLSLMAWLCFAVLLVGRVRLGWRGRRATRVLYAGAALLLLAYAGSRFVFEVLLNKSP